MWEAHEGMGWWMAFGMVWFAVFWGFIVWVVLRVASPSGDGRRGALDIAKERYARGEITREEFERLRSDLR